MRIPHGSVVSRALASASIALLGAALTAGAAELADVEQARAQAATAGKPVLIDFSSPT